LGDSVSGWVVGWYRGCIVVIGLFTLAFHFAAVLVLVLMFWRFRRLTEAPWHRPDEGGGGGPDRLPRPTLPWAWHVTRLSPRSGRDRPRPRRRPSATKQRGWVCPPGCERMSGFTPKPHGYRLDRGGNRQLNL
jgi:hypothetical protein